MDMNWRQQGVRASPITMDDVENVAVYLVRDAAAALNGDTVYADAGYHVLR
jgi:enoyl-[acyl-carrier-protein] reductase (NADH)